VVATKRKTGHVYEISYKFRNKIKPLLPLPNPKKKHVKPGKDDKKIMNDILYLLLTGCQWKALPRCYGTPSTAHDQFQEWQKAGLVRLLLFMDLKEVSSPSLRTFQCRYSFLVSPSSSEVPLCATAFKNITPLYSCKITYLIPVKSLTLFL
jgi:transposase